MRRRTALILDVNPREKAEAIAAAEKAGIDLSLMDSNLELSYEDRVLRHESARELKLALREAGATYARSTSLDRTAR